jgi:hypothetical protein
MSSNTVDNPFFARVWTVMARHEPESLKRLPLHKSLAEQCRQPLQ